MEDAKKTKKQLIDELKALRFLNGELEARKPNSAKSRSSAGKLKGLMRKIFESSPDLLTVLDKDLRILRCNWSGGYDYVPEEIRGSNPYCYEAFYPGQGRQCEPCHALEAFASGKPVKVQKFNPNIGYIEAHAFPVFDDSGTIELVLEHVVNITERKLVEEELHKSNQRLDLLVETARILLESDSPEEVVALLCSKVMAFLKCDTFFNYMVDHDLQRLHLNACAGIPEEDIRKMEWLDYGVGLCGCSARDGSRLVVENLQDVDDQYTALVRPFGIRAYACHPLISQGRVLGTLSFCTRSKSSFTDDDLSVMKSVADQVAIALDRKLSSELISRSEKKFREIFENAHDAIYLMREDSTIFDCNPATAVVFRCEKSELVGKKPTDWSPPVQPDGTDSRRKAAELLDSLSQGNALCFEWLHLRPDGTQFEASVVVSGFELNDTMIFVGILRDISDRKRAEEALRASETRFRSLVETTSDWIWEVDENERYTYASPNVFEYLGYRPEEMIGKTLHDFLIPGAKGNFLSWFRTCKEMKKPFFSLEKKCLHKDGATVIIDTSGVPIFKLDGDFSGFRGIDRNITERKKLEQRLSQAQKMEVVGQLASGIAHDYNNIIMAIKGYVNILLSKENVDQESGKYLNRVDALAERAKKLTHDLMSFSRKKVSSPKPNDLNHIVRNMKNILKWLIGDRIGFRMSLHQGALLIMSVSGQIEQILINIVTNARDATPKGGMIKVSTSFVDGYSFPFKSEGYAEEHGYALLSISDTGIGMDEVTRLRIFEPFFTLKEIGKGTGLGLAVVYGVVENHGGFINVDSKPDAGTTFNIYIPLIDVRIES
ncbi:MAG: PAS domain S-box protein [Geobacteraceae bacterium]|nr:PAS domain S-box protein [Geobacteraceae bacterium]